MSERIHALAYQLFGKTSIEECDVNDLQSFAAQHPYFAPAHFLLLEKLKANPEAYTAQLQKAVLYYHNPLEFEYFINSERFYTEIGLKNGLESAEAVEVNTEPVPTIGGTPSDELLQEDTLTEQPTLAPVTAFNEDIISNTPEPALPEVEIVAGQRDPIEEPLIETFVEPSLPFVVEEDVVEQQEEQKSSSTVLQPANNEIEKTTDEVRPALSFEPYHTVDYFASQGIKLSQEEAGKDKFGKQLKSFTEWLKSMKRLPPPQGQKPETVSEKKVQHLAEDSVNKADVVTEAMAEVWLKQGNNEKAIETYNKLSLLNPSKKPYFAAKIDNLKRS